VDGKLTLDEIARLLYRNEINFSISCFWDGGFDVTLGDAINGFKAKENFDTLPECTAWLEVSARKFYPKAF